MSATIEEIVNNAQEIIGEVAGPGVQTYSEDVQVGHAIRAFNLCLKKYAWAPYCKWFHLTLSGTTGLVTTDALSVVKDEEDFISVNPDGKDTGLPRPPSNINPFRLTSGTSPRYWNLLEATHASYATKRIIVYPITATGSIDVHAKVYPTGTLDPASTLYLDKDMLVYGTAYMCLTGDETNSEAAAAAKELMEMRFRDIISSLGGHKIPLTGTARVPDEWWTP